LAHLDIEAEPGQAGDRVEYRFAIGFGSGFGAAIKIKEPLKNDCACKYRVKNRLKILIDSV